MVSNTSPGDSIKNLRGTTYVQPPQGSSLLDNKLNMPFQVPSFTTTHLHWHQSQLGKRLCSAAGSFWNDLQSMCLRATAHHFLDARLELFWAEDWSALWAMVRAECDVAPVQNTTRRTDKQQMQSRVRKVATRARTVEKGRALAAARNAPPDPSHGADCSRDPGVSTRPTQNPPAPAQAFVSGLFISGSG